VYDWESGNRILDLEEQMDTLHEENQRLYDLNMKLSRQATLLKKFYKGTKK
jgi:hypothetical protein